MSHAARVKLSVSARHVMSEPASEFYVAAELGIEPRIPGL